MPKPQRPATSDQRPATSDLLRDQSPRQLSIHNVHVLTTSRPPRPWYLHDVARRDFVGLLSKLDLIVNTPVTRGVTYLWRNDYHGLNKPFEKIESF